jgi:hypothetical protein
MTTFATRSNGSLIPADHVLEEIRKEIAVPLPVLKEAKRRRDLVLEIAMLHDAARDSFASGSIAHGTENRRLGDADCGIKVDRRYEAFRILGPDAPENKGPEDFIWMFSEFILPRLRRKYPAAEVNLDGNRAIKFELNETVDFDDWGPVDPFVELIVGLERRDAPGIWIPNRREQGWDPADPQHHTYLMTKKDPRDLSIHRAQMVRFGKRAVKRDGAQGRRQVMCSWNLSALGLEIVEEVRTPSEGLLNYLAGSAISIAGGLTEDPAEAVEEPIALPEGVTCEMAAARLTEMATIVEAARAAASKGGARAELDPLFGHEIEEIRKRERSGLKRASLRGDAPAIAAGLGASTYKPTRSGGA